ncbi:MAG: hypothetical protein Q6373_018285 [Candidatus Sigynarchaeota archaeon]
MSPNRNGMRAPQSMTRFRSTAQPCFTVTAPSSCTWYRPLLSPDTRARKNGGL